MKAALSLLFLLLSFSVLAQAQSRSHYINSIKEHREEYVLEHEVVKRDDKRYFRFFDIDAKFCVLAKFTRIVDTTGFMMTTSSGKKSKYFVYGKLKFKLGARPFSLYVYQSEKLMSNEEYADYLFVPFTDITTGVQTYGAGRYIDLKLADVEPGELYLDFNKAYNPYCAYAEGFNCPIPPRQNYINYSVKAGEKNFAKPGSNH
jgi:uncharacterized protein